MAVGVGPGRPRGKPLSVFLSSEDALAFREALASLAGNLELALTSRAVIDQAVALSDRLDVTSD